VEVEIRWLLGWELCKRRQQQQKKKKGGKGGESKSNAIERNCMGVKHKQAHLVIGMYCRHGADWDSSVSAQRPKEEKPWSNYMRSPRVDYLDSVGGETCYGTV